MSHPLPNWKRRGAPAIDELSEKANVHYYTRFRTTGRVCPEHVRGTARAAVIVDFVELYRGDCAPRCVDSGKR